MNFWLKKEILKVKMGKKQAKKIREDEKLTKKNKYRKISEKKIVCKKKEVIVCKKEVQIFILAVQGASIYVYIYTCTLHLT